MLPSRTTDNQGSGGSRPAENDSSSSDHTGVATKIVLPIIFIIAVLVVASLFALCCRRVLHRSRLSDTRRVTRNGQSQTRPTLWEINLSRPEEGGIPLNESQVSLYTHSPIAPSSLKLITRDCDADSL